MYSLHRWTFTLNSLFSHFLVNKQSRKNLGVKHFTPTPTGPALHRVLSPRVVTAVTVQVQGCARSQQMQLLLGRLFVDPI